MRADGQGAQITGAAEDEPSRRMDDLIEALLFSEKCLLFYKALFAPDVRLRNLDKHIRQELYLSGYCLDGGFAGLSEYARLRVPGRFDVVIKTRPNEGEPIVVNGLSVAKDVRRRPKIVRWYGHRSKRRPNESGERRAGEFVSHDRDR